MMCPNPINVADFRFFRRFPERRHRIRVAAHRELEAARHKGVLTAPIPDGYRAHVGLKFDGRDGLHRAIGALPEGSDCDASEADARAAYYSLFAQSDAHLLALAGTPHADTPEQHQPERLPRPRRNSEA